MDGRLRKGEEAKQLMSDRQRWEGEMFPVMDLDATGFDDVRLDGAAVMALVDLDAGLAD